jgi:2-polyprenyl-3-methyl-5-hydroxy-6-metoxy-1,4-benzoquinol methylase
MNEDGGSIFRPSQPGGTQYVLNNRGYGTHQAIIGLVRQGGRILDVGCADGSLGEVLRRDRNAFVVGLESDVDAAARAATVLDQVVVGSVADGAIRSAALEAGPFDQIVLGDVLEHTSEPDIVLRQLRPLLSRDGTFVISLPNVLTFSARARLLAGIWRYEESGIFDRTHLRFFSIASARELVAAAGLDVVKEITVGPLSHRLGARGARMTAWRPGLLARQIVIEARPRPL